MSALAQLVPLIYHERQEKGSMLCAQHALNNLLQEQCFSVPDLSEIARSLDELEQSFTEDHRGRSGNMDDTGFFSLQVLQKALEVWSLSLVSWRSEEMSAYTRHPHTQLAFILNLNEHWFTLRRFGAPPKGLDDLNPGQGHWFNLNSFLEKPEWVGKLYLSMVLQQSEKEGYSVFVVKRMDPAQKAALPETGADRLAVRLADPGSGTSSLPTNRSHTVSSHAPNASRSRSHSPNPPSPHPPSPRPWQEERTHNPLHQLAEAVENERYRDTSYPPYLRGPPRSPGPDVHEEGLRGFERLDHSDDPEIHAAMEDRELQAALQASLISGSAPVSANHSYFDAFQPQNDSGLESPLPLPIPPPLFPNSRSSANRASTTTGTTRSTLSSRNRISVSGSGSGTHSRRERNLASPNSTSGFTEPGIDPDLDPVAASVARNRLIMERMRHEQEIAFRDTYDDIDMEDVSRRSREAQEEEDMLKRAIEESEKLAKEVEEKNRQNNQDHQPDTRGSSSVSPPRTPSSPNEGHRVYDDEDEELQAALRASLQDVPPGYQPPPSPPLRGRRIPEGLTLSRKQTLAPVMGFTDLPFVVTPGLDSGVGTPRSIGPGASILPRSATVVEDVKGEEREMDNEGHKGKGKEAQEAGNETDSELEYEMEENTTEPEEEEVTVEEMRKRRLARFGS